MAGEHKQNKQSEAEARLRAILETAVEGIIVIDHHGLIQLFNRSAERIFCYKEAELIGHKINVLMPSPDREMHDRYIGDYARTRVARIIGIGREVRGMRKDGSTFPMTLAVSEIGDGSKKQYVGIIRDISERKRLEDGLVMATENERQIIGQELHDTLSQQLTAISLMAKALERKLADQFPGGRDEAAVVAEMARDAVNVAKRLAHGLFPTELDRHGLAAALEELADNNQQLFKKECRYSGVRARLELPRPVERHLYRIAQEASSNAIKHSGGRRIEINLEASPVELLLTITDDGCGLPHHTQPGKGMGLAIMKYRSGMINATLTISPGLRSGTKVVCRLPNWQSLPETQKRT